ncbi:MAG TPA: (2Fe-2S) ferredoxin domain-containing protein [Bacteroidales bacterium]|nr:(2Fe-2S) ferredoxin domain-containing protein [Bacteroidales bacterium]
MKKIKSFAELQKLRNDLITGRKESYNAEPLPGSVRVRVHMGTSGIASGAAEIYNFFKTELEKRNIQGHVIKTGDMGYCFAEPTIEVTLPGKEPVVFGNVDKFKADEIIEKYIKYGELVDGVIPVNYQTITI